jgi:hypothetical protein
LAVDDDEILTRKYGYAALFLRRLLHEAIPETRSKNNAIISLMEEVGAINPEDLDSAKLSKWLTGTAPANEWAIRTLLQKRSKLSLDEQAKQMEGLGYLIRHAGSLPNLIKLPNPPDIVVDFIKAAAPTSVAISNTGEGNLSMSASVVVEDLAADDISIGDVGAETGGTSQISAIDARLLEIGDVKAGTGAVARVHNLRANTIKIGTIQAGSLPKKT